MVRAVRWIVLVLGIALILGAEMARACAQPAGPVVIHFFWGEGCPHCAEAKPFLEGLLARHPGTELRSYEVTSSEENAALFAKMAAARGFEPVGVPTILVGERYWIGYGPGTAVQIEAALAACLADGCPDGGTADSAVEGTGVIDLPLLGPVDLARHSLWISTALIAFVDGFNPCSLWVLSILVALALHTGSRQKVLLIGLVFVSVTAAVYALFIAGLFTFLAVVGFAGWIQIVVAAIALVFGAVNLKDYFFYKEGVSFTIDDRHKPGIYRRIRHVIDARHSVLGLVGATVVLAVGVSLVEFSCTAGFPVLWTNLLAAQEVTPTTFVLLLLLYLLIYQLDELAVFLVAVFTLRASRIEEKQGRILKLIGGVLMLTLAGVMLVDPALMNRLGSSLAIFGAAFAASGLVLLVHRRILPAFGIRIGTEAAHPGPPA